MYIKDFPKDQKEEDLIEDMKETFSRYGEIINIKLIKEKDAKDGSLKGFGFIEFTDEDPVDKCNCKFVYCERLWICEQKCSSFADQIAIREHKNSRGSSWDLANALKMYISSQLYFPDDIYSHLSDFAKISPRKEFQCLEY